MYKYDCFYLHTQPKLTNKPSSGGDKPPPDNTAAAAVAMATAAAASEEEAPAPAESTVAQPAVEKAHKELGEDDSKLIRSREAGLRP